MNIYEVESINEEVAKLRHTHYTFINIFLRYIQARMSQNMNT